MAEKENQKSMSKEEMIAYHNGCLNTLLGERNEMIKIVQTVDSFINSHVEELKKLGIKFQEKK